MSRNLGSRRHQGEGRERPHIVIDQWGFNRRAERLRLGRRPLAHPLACPQGHARGPLWWSRRSPASRACHPMKTENIPGCTYCQPQVASIGLTEARGQGQRACRSRSASSPSLAMARPDRAWVSPKASSRRCSDAKTGELLGAAHMIGARGHRTDPPLQRRQGPWKRPRPS